jgi:acyl-CoA reductase-like NAD-dependent aldehyde dehydrogenase
MTISMGAPSAPGKLQEQSSTLTTQLVPPTVPDKLPKPIPSTVSSVTVSETSSETSDTDILENILQQAVAAQIAFAKLGQVEADRIFDAVAKEANKHRLPLAKLAVKETKMGCLEDKVIKNGIAW